METRARLTGVTRDYLTDEMLLTFAVEGDVRQALDSLTDKPLRLKVVQWRDKRSLDSNAYMWLLESKIAQAIGSTTDEVHKKNVLEYGPLDEIDGRPVVITIRSDISIDLIEGYWRLYSRAKDGCFSTYLRVKRTSEYDSKEMSNYLEHVIDEAKELGIETATPDELERMRQLYENKRSGR